MRSPDMPTRRSAAMKACWANPNYRALQIAKHRAYMETPEGKAHLAKLRESRMLKLPPGITRDFYTYIRRNIGAAMARRQLGVK